MVLFFKLRVKQVIGTLPNDVCDYYLFGKQIFWVGCVLLALIFTSLSYFFVPN